MKIGKMSEHDLSLYLSNQLPNTLSYISLHLSKAFLDQKLSLSIGLFIAIIERFGSDCLKRIAQSCCEQSIVQQLIDLSPVQFQPSKDFITTVCTVFKKPSHYKLKKIASFSNQILHLFSNQ